MKYQNAKTILPVWLLEELQDYIQGEVIYIPTKQSGRAGWGAANGAKAKYHERNMEIVQLHKNGACVDDLSSKYHLTEHSIKKILYEMKEPSYKTNGNLEVIQ